MDLTTRQVIAGVILGPAGSGTTPLALAGPAVPPIDTATVTRIWTDVVRDYPYLSLQITGNGGVFLGQGGADDLVLLQPPLVQVRSLVDQDMTHTADKVASIFKTALHPISGGVAFNLGVKIVATCAAPGGDSGDFIRLQLVQADEDVRALAGTGTAYAGVKLIARMPDVVYTVLIEPMFSDLGSLYLDLDAQFPGVVDLGQVRSRVIGAHDFLNNQVSSFLDRRAQEWQK